MGLGSVWCMGMGGGFFLTFDLFFIEGGEGRVEWGDEPTEGRGANT